MHIDFCDSSDLLPPALWIVWKTYPQFMWKTVLQNIVHFQACRYILWLLPALWIVWKTYPQFMWKTVLQNNVHFQACRYILWLLPALWIMWKTYPQFMWKTVLLNRTYCADILARYIFTACFVDNVENLSTENVENSKSLLVLWISVDVGCFWNHGSSVISCAGVQEIILIFSGNICI